ncbi:MAG: sigma-54-dependent transcriptional regulator [Candidatus Eisenbacteria bacterium]
MRILVVDDEAVNARNVAEELRDAGHDTAHVGGGAEAIARLGREPFDAVITDLRMKPPDGLTVLAEARKLRPGIVVVLMTAYGHLETCREAFKLGAYDYVAKEGDFTTELALLIARAGEERGLREENRRLTGTVESLKRGLASVTGDSPAIRDARALAEKVAVTDFTVLLRGESGTGKDLFARAIHYSSPRAAGPWIKVNCGALPEPLLESELFGHEKGAFTGAVRQKPGRFEDADHGTLFLDEIGELPVSLQSKLLQVIEEKTFTRVGGNQPVTVDVRIIAATNRDLETMTRERAFRDDLFYRLNVFPIVLPPLRDRPGDVLPLARQVLARHGAAADRLTSEAARSLERYPFPGNVRELEHTMERALILAGRDPIGLGHLPFGPTGDDVALGAVPRIPPEGLSLEAVEKALILQALDRAGGNKSQAARLLGLTRRTLYSRMEKHGLRTPGEGDDEVGEEAAT